MSDLKPDNIFNDFLNKKLDKSSAVKYLKSIIENHSDETCRINSLEFLCKIVLENKQLFGFLENLLLSDSNFKIRTIAAEILLKNYFEYSQKLLIWTFKHEKNVDCLLTIYKYLENKNDEKSKSLLEKMMIIIGNKYIENYSVNPREAMALGIIEKIVGEPLLNEDEYPDLIHDYASFKVESGNVIILDINGIICPKMTFLELLPFLKFLGISVAELEEISGLEALNQLELLDLHINKINKIQGVGNLKNLKTLIIDNNPIDKLDGVEELKNLTYVEIHDTLIPQIVRERIYNHIETNKKKKTK